MTTRDESEPRVVRFGVFEADLAARELRKRGVRVKLQEQPFRLLATLLERHGEIVTREEIQQQLWPDDTFVDFDKSLNTAAQKVRLALGDSADSPRFLETIPRQGYRWLAPVETTPAPPEATTGGASDSAPALDWSRVLPWALAAVLALALALAPSSRPESEAGPGLTRQFTIVPDETGAGLFFFLGRTQPPASAQISPDGSKIAYYSSEDEPRVWLYDLTTGEGQPLEGTEHSTRPNPRSATVFWSKDGESLGITTPSAIKRFSLRDGSLRTLHTLERLGDFYLGAAWSPDGETLIFAAGSGMGAVGGGRLYSISSRGGEASEIEADHDGIIVSPTYLPASEPGVVASASGDLYWLDPASGAMKFLIEEGMYPSYSPTGHLVFDRPGEIWAVGFDLASLETQGEPFLVARGFSNAGVSRGGDLLAVTSRVLGGAVELTVRNRKGDKLSVLGPRLWRPLGLKVSPKGDRVAISATRRQDLSNDIWVFDLEGDGSAHLTSGAATDDYPIWSPDGSRILFRRSAGFNQDADIFAVDALGRLEAKSFLDTDSRVAEADISPDGKTFIFQNRLPGRDKFGIYTAAISHEGRVLESSVWIDKEFNEVHPQFSPNGRHVAFVSNESGEPRVYIAPFPAGSPVWPASTIGGVSPRWSPDGRELYWSHNLRGAVGVSAAVELSIMAVSVDLGRDNPMGPAKELFHAPGLGYFGYDVLPDGRFVFVEQVDDSDAPSGAPARMRLFENWFEPFREQQRKQDD